MRVDGRPLASAFLYPLVDDPSFERTGTVVEGAFDGQRAIHLGPSKKWNGRWVRPNVRPGWTYRASVMGRRTGTKGEDISALVILYRRGGKPAYCRLAFPPDRADRKVFNEWVRLEGQFTVPPDLESAAIYFYNNVSEETADYDLLTLAVVEEKDP